MTILNIKVTTFQKLKKILFWSKMQIWQIFILLSKGSNAQQKVYLYQRTLH